MALRTRLFGKEQVAKESPYKASLADGFWEVTGKPSLAPVLFAKIRQSNGAVVSVAPRER